MSKNLWKLSVTYLFEDADIPIRGIYPRIYLYLLCEDLNEGVPPEAGEGVLRGQDDQVTQELTERRD